MPCTAAAIAVTTKTPTATPMIVRLARTLLDRMASSAIPTPSLMIVSRSSSRIALLLAKGGDRVEPRGPARRVHPGDDPHACPNQQGKRDRPWCDARRQRGHGCHHLGERDPESDADGSPAHAERGRLDEELRQDVPSLRA